MGMMKKLSLFESLIVASSLLVGLPVSALPNSAQHIYPSGVTVAAQIGSDLYDSLDAKYRNKLPAPLVCPVAFVNLINHIAHAKAIDRIEPGFLDRYMADLARATADGATPVAPDITDDRYWTDSVMNDQSSYFNQMMGMTLAINFSHQYLGQSDKYSSRMPADKQVSINNFLTMDEWEKDVRAGAVNSLNCAFATEGAKALFAAIGKMPRRPAWTTYIVPPTIDTNKLNNQLAKYEVDFFRGGLK